MSEAGLELREEAEVLSQRLFGSNARRRAALAEQLMGICEKLPGRDFLLIHNPGGWGSTALDGLLQWEKSIVDGVSSTVERMGYSYLLVQYFRCGDGWWSHMQDIKEQTYFLFKGNSRKARELAAELRFITAHFSNLKILLIGASQGAAFSNAVMRQISEFPHVYSIELGLFFPHMSRRVITERTLAIDDNGIMPDPMAHRNLWVGFKAYLTAPGRWVKYRLNGEPQKFTYCINAPGHDYNWEYLAVRKRVEEFLHIKFGIKNKLEVRA